MTNLLKSGHVKSISCRYFFINFFFPFYCPVSSEFSGHSVLAFKFYNLNPLEALRKKAKNTGRKRKKKRKRTKREKNETQSLFTFFIKENSSNDPEFTLNIVKSEMDARKFWCFFFGCFFSFLPQQLLSYCLFQYFSEK